MNYTVTAYLIYVPASVAMTIWVARTLHKNGRVFLVQAFRGNENMADSVNHLLVVGFYLINAGFIATALRYGEKPRDVQEMIEFLSTKLGIVLLVLGALLVQAIGNLYLPELNGEIINKGVLTGDTDYVLRVGGFMLLVTALIGAAAVASVYLSSRIAMGFGRDVRRGVFSTVETFSQVEVNRFGPPSLITRNTNDVQQVQTVVFMALTVLVSAPILIIGGIIMALRTDVPLSGLLVVAIPAFTFAFWSAAVLLRLYTAGPPRPARDRVRRD